MTASLCLPFPTVRFTDARSHGEEYASDESTGTFTWQLDAPGTMSVTVDDDCCAIPSEPWQSEAEVWFGPDRHWVGPIDHGPIPDPSTTGGDRVHVTALDRSSLWEARWWWEPRPERPTDALNAFTEALDMADRHDPIELERRSGNPAGQAHLFGAEQWEPVDSSIRLLADSWIDYTVVDNQLHYGAYEIVIPDGPTLSNRSWRDTAVGQTYTGDGVGNRIRAIGSNGFEGHWPPDLRFEHPSLVERAVGLRTLTVAVPDVCCPSTLTQVARSTYWERFRPMVGLTDDGARPLADDAQVDLFDLIPGRLFPIRVGCEEPPVQRMWRLLRVVVSWDAIDGSVDVTPTFGPVGQRAPQEGGAVI